MEDLQKDVENLLGFQITKKQFHEALYYAKNKQNYIYAVTNREVVLQNWYLAKLTEEFLRTLAFSKFTMDLCKMLNDMEKEHSVNDQSTPTNNHIVALPTL